MGSYIPIHHKRLLEIFYNSLIILIFSTWDHLITYLSTDDPIVSSLCSLPAYFISTILHEKVPLL
jgi:hypothetical protein